MAAVATAFLALGLALAQTAKAATGALVSHPEALIEWGAADSSNELSDEDGIVTQPVRAPVNHKHRKRRHGSQHKRLGLGTKLQHVRKHHHRKGRAHRHGNRSSVIAHPPANSTAKVATLQNRSVKSQSKLADPNGTSKAWSGLALAHSKISAADPAHLSALDTQIYSSQAAPQVILDKEQKIGQLEDQNEKVATEFHKLDLAYRDQQVKMRHLRRRFENDQDSIAKGTQELEKTFARVTEKETERKKLLQEQQSVEKNIEDEKAKGERLLHVLELKDHAEKSLREQSANLRKQLVDEENNAIAVQAAAHVEIQNQTKKLEMARSKGEKLNQELKTLSNRLKAQQVDKEDLKKHRELLTEENDRLSMENEKLAHLQSEKVAQMKALQREVHDDRTEQAELQHELDSLETTGALSPPSATEALKPVAS